MELTDKDVSLKMLGGVLPLLEKLHPCGTQRDAAGNRTLFFGQRSADRDALDRRQSQGR